MTGLKPLIKRLVVDRFYEAKLRARKPAARETLVVLGSPRSGTTWLAEQLQRALENSAVLWEPLHLTKGVGLERFGWRPQLADIDADGRQRLAEILALEHINDWVCATSHRRELAKASIVIAKFVRANRIIDALIAAEPMARPIVIFRHPLATITSQERAFDDSASEAQVTDRIAEWYEENAPLLARSDDGSFVSVFYEEFLVDPEAELTRILDELDIADDLRMSHSAREPAYRDASSTDFSGELQPVDIQLRKGLDEASPGVVAAMADGIRRFGCDVYEPGDPMPRRQPN